MFSVLVPPTTPTMTPLSIARPPSFMIVMNAALGTALSARVRPGAPTSVNLIRGDRAAIDRQLTLVRWD